jgi:hypothetical protein
MDGPAAVNVRHVTIDDLDKGKLTTVGHEIKGVRLDAGRLRRLPFQIIPSELRIGRCLSLLGDRLDGGRAVDRLLSAGDVGQPAKDQIRNRGGHGGATYWTL